jgi:hypothetical protein
VSLPLAIPLFLIVGVSLGLLGGGGSILTLPILVHLLGLPTKNAIALSLLVVGATSAAAAVGHARAGRVDVRTALLFGATSMAGAAGGSVLARGLSEAFLLALFAVITVATAVAMLRRPKPARPSAASPRQPRPLATLAEGLVVGAVTGMVGAGGGFLVVPALVLLGGLPMHRAVGTALVVIALKSAAAFAGYAGHVAIDWGLAVPITAAAVAGSLVGNHLAPRVPADKLRRGFALLVLGVGTAMLLAEVPQAAWSALAHAWPAVALFTFAAGVAVGHYASRRRPRRA